MSSLKNILNVLLIVFISLDTTIEEFIEMVKLGCNLECSFDMQCLSYVDIVEMHKLKENFWGKKTDRPQLPKDRRQSIQNIFRTCHANKVVMFLF